MAASLIYNIKWIIITKINKNEPVSLEVLMKICQVFHCDIGDICEVILDED